jgi:hypothetical protein
MNLAMYGKLTPEQFDKLESIEDEVDRILADRVGRRAIWMSAGEAALSKKHRREFVVGYFDADSGISEDVAFFKYATTAKKALTAVCSFLER